MNLNELRDEAYSIAKANGWHEQEHSDEHWLMLVITEIAEAVQADRDNRHADVAKFKEWQGNSLPLSEETRIRRFKEDFEAYIKNSVEDELADVVIRCLDLAGLREWNLPDIPDEVNNNSTTEKYIGDLSFTELSYGICGNIFETEDRLESITDTLLIIISYCVLHKIDLPFFIRTKMNYNRLRGYKHGGKKY